MQRVCYKHPALQLRKLGPIDTDLDLHIADITG